MLNLMYCEHCREKIQSFGEMAEATYETVCEYYVSCNQCMVLFENYFCGDTAIYKVIKLLEEKGYLVTSEVGIQNIGIMPLGCEIVNGEHRICPFNFNH